MLQDHPTIPHHYRSCSPGHKGIITRKRFFRHPSVDTQPSLSKERYTSRRDTEQEGEHVSNRDRRRHAIMGHAFIDLIIIVEVILGVMVFLLFLNWISKHGDR